MGVWSFFCLNSRHVRGFMFFLCDEYFVCPFILVIYNYFARFSDVLIGNLSNKLH